MVATYHVRMDYSTKDRDNDGSSLCKDWKILLVVVYGNTSSTFSGIAWETWKGSR